MKCKYEGTGIYEGRCWGTKEIDPCPGYDKCSQFKPNFITNADHIRSMSDEELGSLLTAFSSCSRCRKNGNDCFPIFDIDEWLKQPKEETK